MEQALEILIAAGLDEEYAQQIKQHVMQPDQGPGGSKKAGIESVGKSSAPAPKAIQGVKPPAEVRPHPAIAQGA